MHRYAALLFLLPLISAVPIASQSRSDLPLESAPGTGLRRSRLYLRDGSYQVVLSYRVAGKNVVYRSAERAGETESIPLNLVDLNTTRQWEKARDAAAQGAPTVQIDPALAKEEADRASRSPEVAKDLRLPDEDSVLALDVYQGQSQLAVLQQTDGELNRQTAHNVLRAAVNPLSSSHQLVEIKGERSAVQMHVPDPVLFVRLEEDTAPLDEVPAGALEIDTHGAKAPRQEKASRDSQYVIVRVDVRRGLRVVTSFSINMLGSSKRQADVVPTATTTLAGGHWLRVAPTEPLTFGEYALMEVLNDRTVNLGVWDFGVHPTAGPNRDAILPEVKRPPSLERRRTPNAPD